MVRGEYPQHAFKLCNLIFRIGASLNFTSSLDRSRVDLIQDDFSDMLINFF